MRMARAFIASVPLAIVLVAALVVPLTVIPGTFGFESWPASPGERVAEPQVRLEPPPVAAVPVRPSRPAEVKRSLASAATAPPAPRAAVRAPAAPAAPAPRTPAGGAGTPSTRHSGGPRPTTRTGTPGRPAHQPSASPEPQQPQQPSSEPEPGPELVAGEDVPVAREDPAAHPAPPPPPTPVEEAPAPAPFKHVDRSLAPCQGHHEEGDQGHGGGDDEQD
jgi:hypothetical protein